MLNLWYFRGLQVCTMSEHPWYHGWLSMVDGVQLTAVVAETVVYEFGDIGGDWCDVSSCDDKRLSWWLTGTVHCLRLDNTWLIN